MAFSNDNFRISAQLPVVPAAGRIVSKGNNAPIIVGMLLQHAERFLVPSKSDSRLNQYGCVRWQDAPEAGDSALLAFDASPQKTHGGGIFRIEVFDSLWAHDSDEGLHHP